MSSNRIPIANIYYLLCYAWDRLEERDLIPVGDAGNGSLVDLFARVLETAVGRLLKRGVARAYQEQHQEIAGIRGRLDIGASVKRGSFSRASAVCQYDELSTNILPNQIIKSTLRQLARVESLDQARKERLRDLYRRFPDVSSLAVTEAAFKNAARSRSSRTYGFLLDVCEIIYRNLMIDARNGEMLFRDFARDEDQMAKVFESFLLRFYATEQSMFRASAKRLWWNAKGISDHVAYLPVMQTDICLEAADQTIVIDAKYYLVTLSERFGKHSIRSGHLYQLFAYMHHLQSSLGLREVSGMLIYPLTTRSVNLRIELSGFPVVVAAIDLTQPWPIIRRELLDLLPRDPVGPTTPIPTS